jgi:hypothetical protein
VASQGCPIEQEFSTGRRFDMSRSDTHTCPYCELVFSYHEEVKDHILHDHREHAPVVAGVEMHELPHD